MDKHSYTSDKSHTHSSGSHTHSNTSHPSAGSRGYKANRREERTLKEAVTPDTCRKQDYETRRMNGGEISRSFSGGKLMVLWMSTCTCTCAEFYLGIFVWEEATCISPQVNTITTTVQSQESQGGSLKFWEGSWRIWGGSFSHWIEPWCVCVCVCVYMYVYCMFVVKPLNYRTLWDFKFYARGRLFFRGLGDKRFGHWAVSVPYKEGHFNRGSF